MYLGERTCAVIEVVVTVIPAICLPDPAGDLDRILVERETPVAVIEPDRYRGGFGNACAAGTFNPPAVSIPVPPFPFPFLVPFLVPFPLNIRSVSFSARIVLEPDKPSAKMMPSTMLDFPLPFGPDMAVKSLKNGIFAFFPNDLKLSNSISLMCMCNQSSVSRQR